MATVISLRPAQRKPLAKRQPSLLECLRRDAQHARTRGLTYDLQMLHYLVRTAKPRAKSVWWRGVWFPIGNGLATRWALDPETGKTLVGAVG